MVVIFRKKRWLRAAVLVVLASLAFVLLYPGSGGSVPPPQTIGRDQVFSAADLGAGGFTSTRLNQTSPVAGGGALALAATVPAGQGQYVSETIKADFPFSALGLHWLAQNPAGAKVTAEVRFSRDGSAWDDWRMVPVDDQELPDHVASTGSAGETIGELVYTDAARYYQYRLNLTANPAGQSPEIARVTASYIDAKGYSEPPLSLAALSRLPAKALAFLTPSRSDATPAIITRSQWGANESWMTWTHEYAPVKKEIIHHTVTSNSDPDPAATVRSIYYYHAVSLDWGDIGYNYLIDQQGRIYEGRSGGPGVIGGHAIGWNTGSVGVSALGNYDQVDINSAMYAAFVDLMSTLAVTNNINPNGSDYFVHYANDGHGNYTIPTGGNPSNFLGHRDTFSTACPGQYLYARLPQFRNEAALRFNPYEVNTPFLEKWNALSGAPGAATGDAYDIPGGRAQNFASGRLLYDQASTNVYWVVGGILAEYDAHGGSGGFLGMPTSDEYAYGVGRAHDFAGGKIYYSSITGAHYVMGAILSKYLAEGGPDRLGFPVTDEIDAPGAGGAREADFQVGRIYWDVDHGAHMIYGGVMGKYLEQGGPGALGIPIADEHDVTGVAGARQSDLASGWFIYWSAATGPHTLLGDFVAELAEWGGPAGYLGLPTSDAVAVPTGFVQDFQSGIITRDGSAHTHVTYGAIAAKYRQLGGAAGALGVATADEAGAPGVSGARESDFVNGRIYWSPATNATGIYGAILARYIQLGASTSVGIPIADEHDVAGVAGARQSDFQIGSIYWSAGTGAWEAYGAIASDWYSLGGPAGGLGLPVSGEIAAGSGRESDFQYGRIYWSAGTGAHAVYGAILSKYLEAGGPVSSLGLPTADEFAYGAGRRSDFAGGFIYWDASVGASIFADTPITEVTSTSSYEVRDGNGTLLASLGAGQLSWAQYNGTLYNFQGPSSGRVGTSYLRMSPTGGGVMQVTSYHDHPAWNPALDDNTFRGAIEVRWSPASSSLWVVNDLPLEQYLDGIAETSSGEAAEYLKTMAVASRSYAYWHLTHGGKYGSGEIFHLKNSRNGNGDDQQYKGYGLEVRFPDLVTAVSGTAGQVVKYGGSVAMTSYFSNSDGRTRSAEEAWSISSWPWLASVADPDCDGMTLSGHGVGLSGYGARARADRGNTFTQILTYYYSGTTVAPADTSGNIRIAIEPVV